MFSFVFQGDSFRSKGEELKLQAPLDKINLHVREGSITPTQVSTGFSVQLTLLLFQAWHAAFNHEKDKSERNLVCQSSLRQ